MIWRRNVNCEGARGMLLKMSHVALCGPWGKRSCAGVASDLNPNSTLVGSTSSKAPLFFLRPLF